MKRYTILENDKYIVDKDNIDNVINKLASLENMIEELKNKQEELSNELELLRKDNQTKSYKFRELLGHKLLNSAMISILESHKLM